MNLEFRTLNANEIECRVGNTIKEKDSQGKERVKAFFLLLYKNARVDQCILDETVGQFGWQCRYYQVKSTMICSVGIFNKTTSEWLWKDNGGDDDFNTEQVKAELSDSFKRACFNWGIGRELYYAPKIYVECDQENTEKARYSVKVIEYGENKRIKQLAIINDKTKKVVYSYGFKENIAQNSEKAPKKENEPQVQEPKGSITTHDKTLIQSYVEKLPTEQSKQNFFNWLDKWFNTMSIENLTKSQGELVVKKMGLDKGE